MAKRRKSPLPDPETVHREMLEDLERNPPPRRRPRSRPEAAGAPPKPTRPRLMLRKLRLVTALHRLELFLRQHCARGTPEVVIVVGRGLGSGAAGPVISPAVQQWCDAHPELVLHWAFAPAAEGGSGALLLRLRPLPR